jgi:hypothetical protein
VEYADIEAAAREQGWRVDRAREGHRRLWPPDKTKPVVIGAGTPSDHRGEATGFWPTHDVPA